MAAFSLPFCPRPFSPVPSQPSFFPFFLVLLRFFSFLFLSAAGALLWPSGPIALLHIGLKRDVRHPAAAEQAAGALLWFVLAAAKRVRPPSALDAKLFLLVAPWGPIAFYFLYRIQK